MSHDVMWPVKVKKKKRSSRCSFCKICLPERFLRYMAVFCWKCYIPSFRVNGKAPTGSPLFTVASQQRKKAPLLRVQTRRPPVRSLDVLPVSLCGFPLGPFFGLISIQSPGSAPRLPMGGPPQLLRGGRAKSGEHISWNTVWQRWGSFAFTVKWLKCHDSGRLWVNFRTRQRGSRVVRW